MNPNKALWEKGDFPRIAATMRASGAAFVDGLAVARDLDVLDLGCGDGTTAIPAAKRGANVLGVDIARIWWRPATRARGRKVSRTVAFSQVTRRTCAS